MRKEQPSSASNKSANRNGGNPNLRMFMQQNALSQYRSNDCQPPSNRSNAQQAPIEPKTELEKEVLNFLVQKKSSNVIHDAKSMGSDTCIDEAASDPTKADKVPFSIGRVNPTATSPNKLGLKQTNMFASPNRPYASSTAQANQNNKRHLTPNSVAAAQQEQNNRTNKLNSTGNVRAKNKVVKQSSSLSKQSYITNSIQTPVGSGNQQILVTNVTKHKTQNSGKFPTPLAQRGAPQRPGSSRPDNIETPHHTNKMLASFARIGMPTFYKLDKITYSRNDISEVANKVIKKFDEFEAVIDYERRKSQTATAENKTLTAKINSLIEQNQKDEHDKQRIREQVSRQAVLCQKLTECLCALKDSMIYNYLVLDFYKEIQEYVHKNQYQNQSDEVMRHLNDVNRIIEQNNLNHVDYDTDSLERVRDECGDFLKSLELDKLDVFDNAPDTNEGVGEAVRDQVVREIQPINSKQGLDKTAENNAKLLRLRSGSRQKEHNHGGHGHSHNHSAPWDPHHTQCAQDTMQSLRQDNQAKQIQISKLATERDQLKRRIIDLKVEIQKTKEKQFKRQQVETMKTNLDKAERSLYIITIQHDKKEVELLRLREDNLKLSAEVKNLNDMLKIQIDHKNEFKKALESEEHFEHLKDAVNHITGMLVSKASQALTPQQKLSLQAIFGDSAVLHTLKQRLTESERHGVKLADMVIELQKVSQSLKLHLGEVWKDLSLVINNFKEVPLEDINQYQILVLKNLIDDKYTEKARDEQLSAQIADDLLRHAELNKLVQSAVANEELSRINADVNDKETILQSFERDPTMMPSGRESHRSYLSSTRGRSIPNRGDMTMSLVSVTQPDPRYGATAQKGHSRKNSTLAKHNKSTLDITLDSVAHTVMPEHNANQLDESLMIQDFKVTQNNNGNDHGGQLLLSKSKSQNLATIQKPYGSQHEHPLAEVEQSPMTQGYESPNFNQQQLESQNHHFGSIISQPLQHNMVTQDDNNVVSLNLMKNIQPVKHQQQQQQQKQQQLQQDAMSPQNEIHDEITMNQLQQHVHDEITMNEVQMNFRHTFGTNQGTSRDHINVEDPSPVQRNENGNDSSIQIINIDLMTPQNDGNLEAVRQTTQESCEMEFAKDTEENEQISARREPMSVQKRDNYMLEHAQQREPIVNKTVFVEKAYNPDQSLSSDLKAQKELPDTQSEGYNHKMPSLNLKNAARRLAFQPSSNKLRSECGGQQFGKLQGQRNMLGGDVRQFDLQSTGKLEHMDSHRSLNSLQQFKDNQSMNMSVAHDRIRGRDKRKKQLEIEGLFREDSDQDDRNKSQARSQTKRKKSKIVSQKKKQLKQENESLKKAMSQMQEKYNDMLLKKVVENEDLKSQNNQHLQNGQQPQTDSQRQGGVGTDENLLDDLLGSKAESAYRKLLKADDFEAQVQQVAMTKSELRPNDVELIRPPLNDDGHMQVPQDRTPDKPTTLQSQFTFRDQL